MSGVEKAMGCPGRIDYHFDFLAEHNTLHLFPNAGVVRRARPVEDRIVYIISNK